MPESMNDAMDDICNAAKELKRAIAKANAAGFDVSMSVYNNPNVLFAPREDPWKIQISHRFTEVVE